MSIDKTWHLANSEDEIKITEFELQLWRVYYGFLRWQEECEKVANGDQLSCDELAILHIIRMKDRPKSIYDIGRLLNRDDHFTINYNLRKLLEMGLISKQSSPSNKKQQVYLITEKGIKNTDAYTKTRGTVLIKEFSEALKRTNIEGVTQGLITLKNVYDEALRLVSSYQTSDVESNNKKTKEKKTTKRDT